MPPIQKVTKEMILETGYQMVQENGIANVNSRSIAQKLGCSTQPVFSQFPNMQELKQSIHDYACEKFERDVLSSITPGSNFRVSYLKVKKLAENERNIFILIYLSEYCMGSNFINGRMAFQSNKRIFEELKEKYQLEENVCTDVMERISLLVHGISTLIATSNIKYDDEQVVDIVENTLDDIIKGLVERSNKI